MAERGRDHGVMCLQLRDVWAAPPGAAQPVLRGVSLEVREGEWLAVGGENGCGKSTLLQVAAGLLAPHRGERRLAFDGAAALRPADGGEESAPRVATVLQDPSVQLFAPTVAEEIGLTALHLGDPPGVRAERVRHWSGALGLEGDLDRPPQELSAGRQQLVLLAAALATEPDLLVADEACAHLDAEARGRVIEALREQTRRGLAIVWATQSPAEREAATRRLDLGTAGAAVRSPWEGEALAGVLEPAAGPEGLTFRVERDPGGNRGPCVRSPWPFELHLPPRGIVTFEGPNGTGKSVLLATACGILDVPQVRVTRDLPGPPPLFVGQFPETQIFEDEVGRELTFAAVSRGGDRREALGRALAGLGRLGLAGSLTPERHTWELSTGERRLVLLVGALIAPASLVALDEPTAGLDPERKAALAGLLAERARSGLVLLASQDAGWVTALPGSRVPIPPPKTVSSPSKKTD